MSSLVSSAEVLGICVCYIDYLVRVKDKDKDKEALFNVAYF